MRMKRFLFSLLTIPLVQVAVFAASPYSVIANRNVFQLKPVVAAPPPVETPPLVKVTLLGIVCNPDLKQVMFRTSVGTPPKQFSCVLSEGERADDVTILEIDQINGLVRIRNQGTEQLLSMEKDALKPGDTVAAFTPPAATRPAIPRPVRPLPAVEQTAPVRSPEEQMILMEINRKLNADKVSKGMMPPMPDTPLTGQ
jgi:hypothetical protein